MGIVWVKEKPGNQRTDEWTAGGLDGLYLKICWHANYPCCCRWWSWSYGAPIIGISMVMGWILVSKGLGVFQGTAVGYLNDADCTWSWWLFHFAGSQKIGNEFPFSSLHKNLLGLQSVLRPIYIERDIIRNFFSGKSCWENLFGWYHQLRSHKLTGICALGI